MIAKSNLRQGKRTLQLLFSTHRGLEAKLISGQPGAVVFYGPDPDDNADVLRAVVACHCKALTPSRIANVKGTQGLTGSLNLGLRALNPTLICVDRVNSLNEVKTLLELAQAGYTVVTSANQQELPFVDTELAVLMTNAFFSRIPLPPLKLPVHI